jgi:A/G-specific adenine glycosylase
MDLGSTVCTSRNPKCEICPLELSCKKYIVQEIKISKKFEGSMRQKRGRILKILLLEKGVTMARLSKELEITNKATEEVVESLMRDDLISISKNKVIVINDN